MKDNRLIAEFMNGKYSVKSTKYGDIEQFTFSWIDYPLSRQPKGDITVTELFYHTSWDWLMPVVEKIEEIDEIDVAILSYGTRIFKWRTQEDIFNNVADISFDKKIVHTYASVVEFIKWYNENK